jgi:single-strand DNA-binding protein
MSQSDNAIHLVGRIGREPDVTYLETGQCRTRFRLATDRPGKPGAEPQTDWHQVVCWGKLAEVIADLLSTGRLVYVAGRLAYGSFEGRDGTTHRTAEIVARDVVLLDRRPERDAPDGAEEDEVLGGAPSVAGPAAAPPTSPAPVTPPPAALTRHRNAVRAPQRPPEPDRTR